MSISQTTMPPLHAANPPFMNMFFDQNPPFLARFLFYTKNIIKISTTRNISLHLPFKKISLQILKKIKYFQQQKSFPSFAILGIWSFTRFLNSTLLSEFMK